MGGGGGNSSNGGGGGASAPEIGMHRFLGCIRTHTQRCGALAVCHADLALPSWHPPVGGGGRWGGVGGGRFQVLAASSSASAQGQGDRQAGRQAGEYAACQHFCPQHLPGLCRLWRFGVWQPPHDRPRVSRGWEGGWRACPRRQAGCLAGRRCRTGALEECVGAGGVAVPLSRSLLHAAAAPWQAPGWGFGPGRAPSVLGVGPTGRRGRRLAPGAEIGAAAAAAAADYVCLNELWVLSKCARVVLCARHLFRVLQSSLSPQA